MLTLMSLIFLDASKIIDLQFMLNLYLQLMEDNTSNNEQEYFSRVHHYPSKAASSAKTKIGERG